MQNQSGYCVRLCSAEQPEHSNKNCIRYTVGHSGVRSQIGLCAGLYTVLVFVLTNCRSLCYPVEVVRSAQIVFLPNTCPPGVFQVVCGAPMCACAILRRVRDFTRSRFHWSGSGCLPSTTAGSAFCSSSATCSQSAMQAP
jgi:hypothetical protein